MKADCKNNKHNRPTLIMTLSLRPVLGCSVLPRWYPHWLLHTIFYGFICHVCLADALQSRSSVGASMDLLCKVQVQWCIAVYYSADVSTKAHGLGGMLSSFFIHMSSQ